MVLIQKQQVSAPEITSNHTKGPRCQFDQYICVLKQTRQYFSFATFDEQSV